MQYSIYENVNPNRKDDKLFAFPIDDSIKAQLENIISKGSGEWKSTTPLDIIGADGSIGITGYVNSKPAYLWMNISDSKKGQAKLELEDRSYLIVNITPENLSAIMQNSAGVDNRKRIYAKNQEGKEFSIDAWNEGSAKKEPVAQSSTTTNVDLETAQEFPGSAPIKGTVAEGKINEQGDFKFDTLQMNRNQEILRKSVEKKKQEAAKKKLEELKSKLNDKQKEVLTNMGDESQGNITTMNNGSTVVYAKLKEVKSTYFYPNGRFVTTKNDGSVVKGNYKEGGKVLSIKGYEPIKSNSVWNSIKKIPSAKKISAPAQSSLASTGFDQAAGDAFRAWANSTDELKKKYGEASTFDLDAKGKPDNSFIRKAYAAAKEEYAKYLSSLKKDAPKEKKEENGLKAGQIVYYRISKKSKEASENESEKAEDSETKSKLKLSDREKAMAKSNESIITNFEEYNSLEEQSDGHTCDTCHEEISGGCDCEDLKEQDTDAADLQQLLIKDLKGGNIKKGVIRKVISKDKISVQDIESEEILTVKSLDIIDSMKVKNAKLKVSKEKKEEVKKPVSSGDKSKEEFKKEKEETKSSKEKLKELKSKKKEAKKNKRTKKRFDKKSKKEDKKQERLAKKIKKQEDSIKEIGESVVYNFDDFMKMIKDLS